MCSINNDKSSVDGDVERLRLDELRRASAGRDEAAVIATVASQSDDASVIVVGHIDPSPNVIRTAHRHPARHLSHTRTHTNKNVSQLSLLLSMKWEKSSSLEVK